MNNNLTPDTNLALLQATQTNNAQASQKIKSTLKEADLAKIDEAAQDFEAMFVSEMMKPLFESIKTDGPFGGGKGEEVFRSMLQQEYGKIVAQTGEIGIADQVKRQMIETQELLNKGDFSNE